MKPEINPVAKLASETWLVNYIISKGIKNFALKDAKEFNLTGEEDESELKGYADDYISEADSFDAECAFHKDQIMEDHLESESFHSFANF